MSREVWILIEVVLFAIFSVVIYFFGLAGAILGSIVLVAFTLPVLARRLAHSRVTVKAFQNFAYRDKKCPYCTAGVQVIKNDGTGWGKIPVHIRRVQDGSNIFHPPHANVRNCPKCGGKGFRPVKVIRGHSERKGVVWPPEDGSSMSSEKVYRE